MPLSNRARLALLAGSFLVLGVPAALLSTWDGSDLGQWVREIAGQYKIDVEGRGYRFSVMDGLILQEPTIRFSLPRGEALLKAPRANVRFQWLRLFRKKYWCDDITAQGAQVALLFNSSGLPKLPEEDERDSMSLEANRLRCEPGALTFEDSKLEIYERPGGEPLLGLDGLRLSLRSPQLNRVGKNPLVALSASGELSARRLIRGGRTYSDVEGKLDLLDGKLGITNLRFETSDGRFEIKSGTLDLSSASPSLDAELSADLSDARFLFWDLDIGLARPLPGQLSCRIYGPLSRLSAKGKLFLDPDTTHLRQMPLIDKAGRLALRSSKTLEARGRWVVPFTFDGSRIRIQNANLDTNPLAFKLGGTLEPDKDVDLQFDIVLPKSEVAGRLSAAVLSSLEVPESPADIRIPGRISGKLAAPDIGLRKDARWPPAVAEELEEYLRQQGVRETTKSILP